jgi:hypothetical protein
VQISNDGGTNWTYVENTKTSDRRWRRNVFRIADVITPTANMRLRFIASDSIRLGQNLDGGSLIEAAVDDIQLWDNTVNSIDEETALMNVSVYPNPTNSLISVDFDDNIITSYVLYDIQGREVLSENKLFNDSFDIDLSSFNSGIYLLKIATDKGDFTQKVIKN